MTWGNDSRSNNDAGRDDAAGRNGFSHRAERLFAFCLRCAARLGILPIARSTRSVPKILPMSSSLTFRAE